MNFNLDGIGRKVAIIKGDDKYKKKILSIHDEDKGEEGE